MISTLVWALLLWSAVYKWVDSLLLRLSNIKVTQVAVTCVSGVVSARVVVALGPRPVAMVGALLASAGLLSARWVPAIIKSHSGQYQNYCGHYKKSNSGPRPVAMVGALLASAGLLSARWVFANVKRHSGQYQKLLWSK